MTYVGKAETERKPRGDPSLAFTLKATYEQKRITLERALHALARTTRRGTLTPEWIQSAVRVVAEIRRKGEN